MRRLASISLAFFLLTALFSCTQEICPGSGSYTYAAPRKITHKSARVKVRESMIHSHKPAGRKPPKRSY